MSRASKYVAALIEARALRASRCKADPPAPPSDPNPEPPPTLGPTPSQGTSPMILTVDEFVQVVEQWAKASLPAIGRVWPLRGGWEEWAQAEIAAYINAIDPSYSVEREADTYGDRRRADLLINQGASQWAQEWIVVEMKCQCPHSPYAFAAGFNHHIW